MTDREYSEYIDKIRAKFPDLVEYAYGKDGIIDTTSNNPGRIMYTAYYNYTTATPYVQRENWSVDNENHVWFILNRVLLHAGTKTTSTSQYSNRNQVAPYNPAGVIDDSLQNILNKNITITIDDLRNIKNLAGVLIYGKPAGSESTPTSKSKLYYVKLILVVIICVCMILGSIKLYMPETSTEYAGSAGPTGSAECGSCITVPKNGTPQTYLRADGTWATLPIFAGSLENKIGQPGYVPAPLAGYQNSYLKGDGTWAVLPGTTNTYLQGDGQWGSPGIFTPPDAKRGTPGTAGYVPMPQLTDQQSYLRGDGTWGRPAAFSGSAGTNTPGAAGYVPAPPAGYQNSYLKGDGTWATLPGATNMYLRGDGTWGTMRPFIGASADADGSSGGVPAPNATQQGAYLRGDGTWGTIQPFVGASIDADGVAGGVPAPKSTQQGAYLRGDGTWAEFSAASANAYLGGNGAWVQRTYENPTKVALGGYIAALVIFSGGAGYSTPPDIIIAAPPSGGVQATAFANITADGVIASVTVSNMGWGYTSDPLVTIIGEAATPAVLIAYVIVSGLMSDTNSGANFGHSDNMYVVMQSGDVCYTPTQNNGDSNTQYVPIGYTMPWQKYVDSAGNTIPQPKAVRIWVTGNNVYVLGSDAYLYAQGGNSKGECGTGNSVNLQVLTRTLLPRGLVKFACSYGINNGYLTVNTSCIAMLADNSIWVWGSNDFGELGLGHKNTVLSPTYLTIKNNANVSVPFESVYNVAEVYMFGCGETNGTVGCLLLYDGTVLVVGYNYRHILSNGSRSSVSLSFSYVQVSLGVPLTNVIKVGRGSPGLVFLLSPGIVFTTRMGNVATTDLLYVQELSISLPPVLDTLSIILVWRWLVTICTTDTGTYDISSTTSNQYTSALIWPSKIIKLAVTTGGGIATKLILLPDGRLMFMGYDFCSSGIKGSSIGVNVTEWTQVSLSRTDIVDICVPGHAYTGSWNNMILTSTGELYITGFYINWDVATKTQTGPVLISFS
jgi:hypothetical protein